MAMTARYPLTRPRTAPSSHPAPRTSATPRLLVGHVGTIAIVRPTGLVIDVDSVGELRGTLDEVVRRYPRLVLDLHRLHFLDSSGIGLILRCGRRAAAAGGAIKLVAPRQIQTLFGLLRLTNLFEVTPNVREGVRRLLLWTPSADLDAVG